VDRLTFIATLVGYVAWPVTTLLLASLILPRLPKLAKFVKAVRYRDFEVTIREDFTQARSEAERLAIERNPISIEETSEAKVLRLAEVDPSIAIIEVWRRLEREIVKLIQHNGLIRFTAPMKFMEHLARLGKLTQGDMLLFRKLRDIRNASVHAPEGHSLSKGEVLEFSNFVDLLSAKLHEIKQNSGYIDLPGPQNSE
jgi:hypothetical protein